MKKILLLSFIVHVLLLALVSPWLVTRMEFSKAEETQRTQQVKKRELARKEFESRKRETVELDQETAKLLKKEAEKTQRKEMDRQLADLEKLREQMLEKRDRELKTFRKRSSGDVIQLEQIRISRIAEKLVNKANDSQDVAKRSNSNEVMKMADEIKKKTEEIRGLLQDDPPSPANIPKPLEALSELRENLDKHIGELSEYGAVRNTMHETQREAKELAGLLEGLVPKTDMAAMNDSSASKTVGTSNSGELPQDAAGIYQQAAAIEKEIAQAKADIDAAAQAVSQNTSFADARDSVADGSPNRPDLASALGGPAPSTVGDLNGFRNALGQASNQMRDMTARAQAALGGGQGQTRSTAAFASHVARSSAASMDAGFGAVIGMKGFGGPGESGSKMRADQSGGGGEMLASSGSSQLHVNQEIILSVAMPGRRFTKESSRRGWLYLDTWYVIGPWENHSKIDFTVTHPPENGIDFDATYYDGKFADDPNHPDRVIEWEFYQSDQVRNQPPRVYSASTFYAYTDVWFDKARDMLIAIASDDAASVWLNGEIIWQDNGQSAWQLGEGYRRVHFRKGFNDILVRIENGPRNCVWSVVLCPPEVLEK